MPYPLNNVTVDNDSYDDARTCRFQVPTKQALVSVSNQAVYVQVERVEQGMRTGSGNYLPEEFWIPGTISVSRDHPMGSIRFRRADPTVTDNPQVTAR